MVTGFRGLLLRTDAQNPAKKRTFRTLSAPGNVPSFEQERRQILLALHIPSTWPIQCSTSQVSRKPSTLASKTTFHDNVR
jgi:hypothetical protein